MKKTVQIVFRRREQYLILIISMVIFGCNGVINLTGNTTEQIVPDNKSIVTSQSGLPYIYEAIDTLFNKYVTSDRGLVDYIGIYADSLLINLKDTIAHFDVSSISSREDSLAFYINAYNVMVIYHLQSYGLDPQSTKGFPLFSKPIMVGGETLTLDQLEKVEPAYIARFEDPRTHFAIVCAALSCPPLLNRAYRGNVIYKQLDNQSTVFLNTSEFNEYEPSPAVSELFAWYESDYAGYVRDSSNVQFIAEFTGGTANDFIASYLKNTRHSQSVKSNPLTFKKYDWTINHQ